MSDTTIIVEPDYSKFDKDGLNALYNYFLAMLENAKARKEANMYEENKQYAPMQADSARFTGRDDMLEEEIVRYKTQLNKLSRLI